MSIIAVVQESSVFLDRQKTIAKAVVCVQQAADAQAQLVIFPEAFISAYPAWVWRLRPGGDWNTNEKVYTRMLNNAVDLNSEQLAPLCQAAVTHQLTIVCGINEIDRQNSGGTLYNSLVVISPQGEIINHHRKLMPTNPERMVWGFGDGAGLNAVETPAGKIGCLICWENYMPLARYSLYAQGIEILIAPTYDSGDEWIGTMQHIAREGRCWVISSGVILHHSDIPEDFPNREQHYPEGEEWINPGDSVVIAPGGKIIVGPMHQQKGLLIADIDASDAATAKRSLDVSGHYARPDVFSLQVNRAPQRPVRFD